MTGYLTFHEILRWIHIAFGFAGLAVFWAPVFAKKGGGLHVRFGKLFLICAYVVGISALVSCGWALVHPGSFISLGPNVSAERVAEFFPQVRFFFGMLGVLAILLLSAVEGGIPVLRTRRQPEKLDSPRLRFVYVLQTLASAVLLAGGVWHLAEGSGLRYLIWIGVGALSLADARSGWQHMKNPLPTPMAWWYRHMECMLGAGIAFHTAFAVFGARGLLGLELEGTLALLPWVLPAAIGVPATSIWIRNYRRKFGELGARRSAAAEVTVP